jgi:hypothetical protein
VAELPGDGVRTFAQRVDGKQRASQEAG